MLANQQEYAHLLELLGDGFKDGDDPFLSFFIDTIEPLYSALCLNNINQLFDALGSNKYPIEQKRQKRLWRELKDRLSRAREQAVNEVMSVVYDSQLIPIPPKVYDYHKQYPRNSTEQYANGTLADLYNLQYSEILHAIDYLKPEAYYSTDHGVKGEEYENIIFVIGRGWNNYQFEKYMYLDPTQLQGKEYDAYIRNRNLFYVCCSRSKKRLVLFISIQINNEFLTYLQNVFGKNNIYSYGDFIKL